MRRDLQICWWHWSGRSLVAWKAALPTPSYSFLPLPAPSHPSHLPFLEFSARCEVSNIRASGSYIRGTNGHSNGLVPMLRNFNETARYVDQGAEHRTSV